MAAAPLRLLLLALGLSATCVADHPVVNVIQLLKDLAKKALEEGQAEEIAYTKFSRWCANSEKTLSASIAEEKDTIDGLQDQIASYTKAIEVLEQEMAALKDEIQELDTRAADAQQARNKAASTYAENNGAHSSTLEAIGEAIKLLSDSKDATDPVLAQEKVAKVLALLGMSATAEQKQTLQGVVGYVPKERPDLKAEGDNEGHVNNYKFKSDSVIELLKDLRLKFEDELTKMHTEETNSINAFELEAKAREQMRAAKEAAWNEKNTIKGQREGDLSTAQSQLTTTQADLQADSTTLDDTMKQCRTRKVEWEERSKVRAGEQEAIAAAIDILAKVTGVRTEAPSNPVPPPSPVSFIQVNVPQKVRNALELLRKEANTAHSRALAELADQLARKEEGPFDTVINAIEKMIFRLMDEQKQEDDHKNWCDNEISKTQTSLSDKQANLDELQLKIQDHTARASLMLSDINTAQDKIVEIVQHVKDATEVRKVGKEQNALAVKDAQDAQTSITQAIAVLRDFYKSSGSIAPDFIQEPVTLPETPSTWDSAYTHVADPKAQPGGIISVLEKISADFAKMEADTKAQEESDQQAYDEEMSNCEINRARLTKEVEMKTQERQRVLQKMSDMEREHKEVSKEFEATEQYDKDLQHACVDGSSTYDARKAARAEEITALKQAQDLLQNAFEEKAVALQLRRRGALRGVIAA